MELPMKSAILSRPFVKAVVIHYSSATRLDPYTARCLKKRVCIFSYIFLFPVLDNPGKKYAS